MKIELDFFEEADVYTGRLISVLSFSFWKREVKTEKDRELIADLVRQLYHSHCVDSSYSKDNVENLVSRIKHARIGILVTRSQEDNEVYLYTYNANKKDVK